MAPKSDSAEGIVLNFVNEQNRPVNVQNVADALQKYAIKKTTAQKVLDALADSGQISFKEYGKQKIYLARQDQFQIPNPQELQELHADNERLKNELQSSKTSLSALESDLRILESNLTLEEIRDKERHLKKDIRRMQEKLESMQKEVVLVKPEERQKLQEKFVLKISEWKKRRKIFKELWDVITEAMTKDLKEFKEELGIEVDEDLNINLQEYDKLFPKKMKR